MLKLPSNLAALSKICAKAEHARFGAITGLRLRDTVDGYEVVVADGKRMAVVTGPECEIEPPEALCLPFDTTELIVSGADWARLLKSAVKAAPPLNKFALAKSALCVLCPQEAVFQVGNAIERVPQVKGRFPNVEQVAETMQSIIQIAVDARLLAELLLVAAEFPAVDDSNFVVLHFQGRNKPLLVTTRVNSEGQRFQGVLMPMGLKESD